MLHAFAYAPRKKPEQKIRKRQIPSGSCRDSELSACVGFPAHSLSPIAGRSHRTIRLPLLKSLLSPTWNGGRGFGRQKPNVVMSVR